jgi:hypothetical protein
MSQPDKPQSEKHSFKNPFAISDDWFSEVVKLDARVLRKSREQFTTFIHSHREVGYSAWSFGSLFYNLSRHAALAMIVGVVICGSIAGSAQAFAPENLKPATIYQSFVQRFESNKQVERDPFTSLQPDSQNDVFNYDSCGLSVKYPKKIGEHPISPLRMKNYYGPRVGLIDLVSLSDAQLTLDNIQSFAFDSNGFIDSNGISKEDKAMQRATQNAKNEKTPIHDLQISCFDKNSKTSFTDLNNNGVNITKEELRAKVGWFINEGNIQYIRSIQLSESLLELRFEYGDKAYNVLFSDPDYRFNNTYDLEQSEFIKNGLDKFEGIFGNQIQIQFNDLVQNKSNVDIKDGPSSSKVIDSTSIAQVPASSVPGFYSNVQSIFNHEKPGPNNLIARDLHYGGCGSAYTPTGLGRVNYILEKAILDCFVKFYYSMPANQANQIKIGYVTQSDQKTVLDILDCKFLIDSVNAHGEYDGTVYDTLTCGGQKTKLPIGEYLAVISFDNGKTFEQLMSQANNVTNISEPTQSGLTVAKDYLSADRKTYSGLEKISCDSTAEAGQYFNCQIYFDRQVEEFEMLNISLILRRDTGNIHRPVMTGFNCSSPNLSDKKSVFTCSAKSEYGVKGAHYVDFVAYTNTIENQATVQIVEPTEKTSSLPNSDTLCKDGNCVVDVKILDSNFNVR